MNSYNNKRKTQKRRRKNKLEPSEKSDYTPALALSKHMASVSDEKCREKEKGVLNRRKLVLNPTIHQVSHYQFI